MKIKLKLGKSWNPTSQFQKTLELGKDIIAANVSTKICVSGSGSGCGKHRPSEERKESVIVGCGSGSTGSRKRKTPDEGKKEGVMVSRGSIQSKKRRKMVSRGSIQSKKTRKMVMDRSLTHRCSALLEALKKHKVFDQSLDDPNNKPDCFHLMKNPMDLATIGSNLANNSYIGVQDFMADIGLALDNALLQVSEEVKAIIQRWKSLEENRKNQEDSEVGDNKKTLGVSVRSRQNCSKLGSFLPVELTKPSKPEEEKVMRLRQPLNAKAIYDHQTQVRKLARKNLPKRRMISYMGPCSSKHASSKKGGDPEVKVRSAVAAAHASKLDCQTIVSTLTPSQVSPSKTRINPHSDGIAFATASVHHQISETILLPAPIIDVQMSPKNAIRAEKLKTRFADTILKAQQTLGLIRGRGRGRGDKTESVKTQQEKEKLATTLHQHKANVEAHIMEEELDQLKKPREREREAARIALEKMENTAGIENNLEIVEELDMLRGWSHFRGNPLHQLGLFLKKEYLEDDDDEAMVNEELEEGEILS